MTPLYPTNLFTPLTTIRETRQSTDTCMALKVSLAKKECYATSSGVTGTIIWNNLNAQSRAMNPPT